MEKKGLSRRNFLRLSSFAGTAFCIGFCIPGMQGQEDELTILNEASTIDTEMNAWISIDNQGKITLVDHRAEMGQGSYHSVPQIIAEELEVDLKDVHVIFAQGNREKYGSQITGGSSTIRGSYKKLLRLSASARVMLIMAAAKKWDVPVSECHAASGHVIHQITGKKIHYGEVAADAAKLEPPKDVPLKKISEYKVIRKPLRRIDTPSKINGQAIFGLDKTIPGMLYAAVERNPRLRGKIKTYDASAALKIHGVKKVFPIKMGVFNTTREGIAVVATSTWAAFKGKKALQIEWDDSGFEHVNSEDIFRRQLELLNTQEGLSVKKQGDPDSIIASASQKIDVIYQTPYQSHSAMEPLNCVAHYQGDKVEIWGPIQAPEWVQDFISQELQLPKDKVIVNMTFLGGGFGRKAFMDYPHEATMISKEIGGPVQVVWTREDDMTQGPYRAGISYRCEGAISGDRIAALKFRMAGQNEDHWRGAKPDQPNRSTAESFLKPYYNSITHISFSDIPFQLPIPNMWWRSVYASTNGFAYESFINEMAALAGKDPIDFRREYLQEERTQRLIDKLEEVSGWKAKSRHQGFGVAITECFGTTVGQVVKVSRTQAGNVKIDRVLAVIDCGWYVNPDIIRAQVEGAIIMALGAATTHEITFKDGLVQQSNFFNYDMPRIHNTPEIEVYIMENEADAGGVGEPGLPPFAPALTEAVFDLTGKRIRKLPFDLNSI